MRALVVEELAADYAGCVLKDMETPKPGPGEVLVKVRAAAVNFPDLLQTRGEYQHKPPLPFIPGLEMSGEIEARGRRRRALEGRRRGGRRRAHRRLLRLRPEPCDGAPPEARAAVVL